MDEQIHQIQPNLTGYLPGSSSCSIKCANRFAICAIAYKPRKLMSTGPRLLSCGQPSAAVAFATRVTWVRPKLKAFLRCSPPKSRFCPRPTSLSHLAGTDALLAALVHGSGLRLREALGLRIKDVDFDRHAVIVRGGVYLPHALERKYPRAGESRGWFCVFPSIKQFAWGRLRPVDQRARQGLLPACSSSP